MLAAVPHVTSGRWILVRQSVHFERACRLHLLDISSIQKVKPAESLEPLVHIYETMDTLSHSRRHNTKCVLDINLWE